MENIDQSMLTSKKYKGEHNDKKVQYNKYFTMVAQFKGEAARLNPKDVTSKKDKQKIIQNDLVQRKDSESNKRKRNQRTCSNTLLNGFL